MNNNKEEVVQLINQSGIHVPEDADLSFVELPEEGGWGPIATLAAAVAVLGYVGMAWSVRGWCADCSDRLALPEYMLVNPEDSASFRLSFASKIAALFKPESTETPAEVSLLAWVALPLLIFGQLFIVQNFVSLNLLSHDEWYPSLSSVLALLSLHLPDLLLLGSGLTLSKPSRRLALLVPCYYLAFLFLLSTMQASQPDKPIWFAYSGLECGWVVEGLFMGGGCPWAGFYLRTEVVGVVLALALGVVAKKVAFRLAFLLCFLLLLLTGGLLFIGAAELPHDFPTVHNPRLYHYLSNTGSHLFFYILGVFLSMIKRFFPASINANVEKWPVRGAGIAVGVAGLLLVGFAPW